jgi:hypothetical protein
LIAIDKRAIQIVNEDRLHRIANSQYTW